MDETFGPPPPLKPKVQLFGNFVMFLTSAAALVMLIVLYFILTLPNIAVLETCFTTSMYQVKLCPTSRDYVKLKDVSPYVIHAIIVSEDGAFYSHKGFDWHEIQQSLSTNLRAGKFQRGGSTLTQQLAKNAFLTPDKSIFRKLREAYLAYAMEKKYKKDFILEKYLNVVEFGPDVYGVKAAARYYFHKAPSQLHLLEAAYLAHLLPNPKVYSQGFRRGELSDFSKRTIEVIVRRLKAFGKVGDESVHLAMASIEAFPWGHLSIDSFSGSLSHSLDGPAFLPSGADLDFNEESLIEILRKSDEEKKQNQIDTEPIPEVTSEAPSTPTPEPEQYDLEE